MVRKVSESSIPLPANDGRSNEEISGRAKLIAPKESFWKSLVKSIGELFLFPVKMFTYVSIWAVAKGIDLVNVHRKRRGGAIEDRHHAVLAQDLAEWAVGGVKSSVTRIAEPAVSALQIGAAAARGYDVEAGSGYDRPTGHGATYNHQTDIPMIPNVRNNEELQKQTSEFLIPTGSEQLVGGRGNPI